VTVARNGEVRSDEHSRQDSHDATHEDDFLYYLHRGSDLLQKRRPEEARVSLERAYQLSPKNPKAQNLLGLVYFKLGLLEAAKSIYDRMVDQYPNEPALYVNLGLVLLRQGRLHEAERALRKAIAISPDHHRAHCYLGLVLYRRGDLAAARDHFVRGQAEEFARKVEQKLARQDVRPSEAEVLRAVADTGFHDIEASAIPFKPLDYTRDERVVRDEEAWEARVTHGTEPEKGSMLGIEMSSLLPVWSLTPSPPAIVEAGPAHDLRDPRPPSRRVSLDSTGGGRVMASEFPEISSDALIARLASPLASSDIPPKADPETAPAAALAFDVLATGDVIDPVTLDMPEAILFGGTAPTTQDVAAIREVELKSETRDLAGELIRETAVTPGFHAGPGARARLVMEGRAYLRASAIVAASGPLTMTPAISQLQGNPTGTHFGDPTDSMCTLEGNAILLLRTPRFAVALRGVRDLSVIESALIGFDKGFTWDNGKVLGMDVVTLRGLGSLLLDTRGDPMLIPVDADTPVHAAREGLLAWSEGVRPSPVETSGRDAPLFRLRGRGYVLVAFPPEPAINQGGRLHSRRTAADRTSEGNPDDEKER
jgi:Tfp pilus assembly protein PilF